MNQTEEKKKRRKGGRHIASLNLTVGVRYLLPLLIFLSFDILIQGHHEPGGGFVGGIVAASAIALYALSCGPHNARKLMRVSPRIFIAGGLTLALVSGCVPLFVGAPFLTGIWGGSDIPVIQSIGTPLFFDIGVYLLVIGVMMTFLLTLMEDV